MPVTVPINSVATVRHNYHLQTDKAFNLLHYQLRSATVIATGLPLATDPIASDALPALAEGIATVYGDQWAAAASIQVEYEGCTVQKVYPGDRSVQYTYALGDPIPGVVVGDALPLQDSATLLKKTDIGQRWGMGRFFFVGIAESEQTNGVLSTAMRDALITLASQLGADYTVDDGTIQYVWRPVLTNVPTTGFPRVNDIVRFELSDLIIKSQKRRRPGKGI